MMIIDAPSYSSEEKEAKELPSDVEEIQKLLNL